MDGVEKSPPINSVVYTAAQRALRKALGRDDFTISLDSSSPHQLAVLMEPFMRKGKDKSHTDANEDRDDSNEVEDFVLS